MIFGRETEHGSVIDLRDLRDGPDFIASCLDVEAWEEELEADPSFALRASEGTGEEERVKDESLKDEALNQGTSKETA